MKLSVQILKDGQPTLAQGEMEFSRDDADTDLLKVVTDFFANNAKRSDGDPAAVVGKNYMPKGWGVLP